METNKIKPPGAASRKVWTEAELQALPKADSFHGDICTRLSAALLAFAETRRLGAVWDSNTGFRMNNCNVLAPDVSFVSRARLKEQECKGLTRRFFPGAPDLAVDVLSPNNTRQEMDGRLKDYFSSGSRLAWIVDAEAQQLEACHSLTARRWVGSGGFLDGEDLLPGFRYFMADLFKDWDWE
jgi:Uma2 family endonuclease